MSNNPHQRRVFLEGNHCLTKMARMICSTSTTPSLMRRASKTTSLSKSSSPTPTIISQSNPKTLNMSTSCLYPRELSDLVADLNDKDHSEDEGI